MATPFDHLLAPETGLAAELPRGSDIPEDHDPLAAGVLMLHQIEWIEDKSPLKLCEKGRRTGVTYAEALDDTIVAASARSAGGDNVFYIGDTKDKGREFIGYCAHMARVVSKELVAIEEFMFEDQAELGETRYIAAYRIRFASGYRIEALSSRPANIRGLQGIVVIDEAAFHKDVREVIDAVNALLIWGGKVRIISTHDGSRNAFNILIRETKAGKADWSLHFIPFAKAVENGLYERVCLIKGETPTPEGKIAWEKKIRGSYGTRKAQMAQELDCVPKDSDGSFMSQVLIESCQRDGIPVIRWAVPPEIGGMDPEPRKVEVARWCDKVLKPLLTALAPRLRKALGTDIGRRVDATAIWLLMTLPNLLRETQVVLELREAPFAVQQQVLWYIIANLRNLQCAAIDATGIGAAIAEATREKFGSIVHEIMLSREWYRMNMEPYRTAFEEKTIVLPADMDILADHQAIEMSDGIAKVPNDHREEGTDGYMRHGDTAIAGALAYYASKQEPAPIDFQTTGEQRASASAFGESTASETRPDVGFGAIGGGTDMRGF